MSIECEHHNCHGDSHGNHNVKSCVSIVPIFNHLAEEEMREIMLKIRHRTYKKGELVYMPGEKSDTLYIVNRGRLKLYRISESGKEQVIGFLNPGEFTGELSLFREGYYERFAEATMDTQLCTLSREDLNEFLLRYPSISLKLLAELSNRVEESERQRTRYATERVETRIALFIAESLGNDGSDLVELQMSKKDLASYLGTTPETISRKFAELEEDGYIERVSNKSIKVLDLDGLLMV
ncbi:MAG: Crp/Fnr family transcriptional regulator [Clostridiales bacterium]|nr:Crp/Fnr family transcriptional regulator [Clostridiales bacterium]